MKHEIDELMKDGLVLAESHVNWFLNIMRPLLVSEFLHGYKHGLQKISEELGSREQGNEPDG